MTSFTFDVILFLVLLDVFSFPLVLGQLFQLQAREDCSAHSVRETVARLDLMFRISLLVFPLRLGQLLQHQFQAQE